MPADRSRQLSSQLLWLQPVNRPVTPMLDGFLEIADLSCITYVEIGTKAILVDPDTRTAARATVFIASTSARNSGVLTS